MSLKYFCQTLHYSLLFNSTCIHLQRVHHFEPLNHWRNRIIPCHIQCYPIIHFHHHFQTSYMLKMEERYWIIIMTTHMHKIHCPKTVYNLRVVFLIIAIPWHNSFQTSLYAFCLQCTALFWCYLNPHFNSKLALVL